MTLNIYFSNPLPSLGVLTAAVEAIVNRRSQPQTSGGQLGKGSTGSDRQWYFCSDGVCGHCVGPGMTTNIRGDGIMLPGTVCTETPQFDYLCDGLGNYFLTIPRPVGAGY